jgi:hypothetical protein
MAVTSKLPLVWAVNQTAGVIELENLGITFTSGSTVELTEFLFGYEINSDPELFLQIASGNILLRSQSTGPVMDSTGSENWLRYWVDTNSAVEGDFIRYDAASGKLVVSSSTFANGDVQGPDASEDQGVARFDGTTGKIITGSLVFIDDAGNMDIVSGSLYVSGNLDVSGTFNDRYFYPPAAVDPTFPSPVVGSKYYNTALEEEMAYDATRTKWLSVSSFVLQSGKNARLGAGQYFRAIDGTVLDDGDRGIPAHKGTIVSVALQRTDADATVVEFLNNGGLLTTVLSSSATAARDDAYDEDLTQGRVSFRIKSTENAIQNGQLVVVYKKRV